MFFVKHFPLTAHPLSTRQLQLLAVSSVDDCSNSLRLCDEMTRLTFLVQKLIVDFNRVPVENLNGLWFNGGVKPYKVPVAPSTT